VEDEDEDEDGDVEKLLLWKVCCGLRLSVKESSLVAVLKGVL
jgi:hypothetical protein